jgi:hypothetical protein
MCEEILVDESISWMYLSVQIHPEGVKSVRRNRWLKWVISLDWLGNHHQPSIEMSHQSDDHLLIGLEQTFEINLDHVREIHPFVSTLFDFVLIINQTKSSVFCIPSVGQCRCDFYCVRQLFSRSWFDFKWVRETGRFHDSFGQLKYQDQKTCFEK